MALPAGRYGVTKNQLLKIKKLPMNTIKLIEELTEKYEESKARYEKELAEKAEEAARKKAEEKAYDEKIKAEKAAKKAAKKK